MNRSLESSVYLFNFISILFFILGGDIMLYFESTSTTHGNKEYKGFFISFVDKIEVYKHLDLKYDDKDIWEIFLVGRDNNNQTNSITFYCYPFYDKQEPDKNIPAYDSLNKIIKKLAEYNNIFRVTVIESDYVNYIEGFEQESLTKHLESVPDEFKGTIVEGDSSNEMYLEFMDFLLDFVEISRDDLVWGDIGGFEFSYSENEFD